MELTTTFGTTEGTAVPLGFENMATATTFLGGIGRIHQRNRYPGGLRLLLNEPHG